MVSSVCSEKLLSAHAERLPSKQAYENSSITMRRKRRRRNWTEFAKTAKSGGASDGGANVIDWLMDMEPSQRHECLSYEHGWLCFVIQRMFHRKVKDGDGYFSLQEDRLASGELDVYQDCFYFQKKEHEVFRPGTKQSLETELESLIRFTDGEDYLDTITVSSSVAKNPQRLLELMKELTHNRAFEVPCKLVWDSFFKMWTLESPAWFCATTFNSVASWICCVLEKAIWCKYWEKFGSETKKSREIAVEASASLKYLTDSPSLTEYWISLSRNRKNEIIGDYHELTQNLLMSQLDEFVNEKPDAAVFVSSFFCTSFSPGLISSCLIPQKFAELRRKVNFYNSEDSVRDLVQAAFDKVPEDFFEYILLSPLDRAGSRLDQLCRKIANKIKDALSQKNADELLIAEWEKPPAKKMAKSKKKEKRGKRRLSEDSSSTSASGRVNINAAEEEIEESYGRKFVASLLENIIKDIKETPQTSEPMTEDIIEVPQTQESVGEDIKKVPRTQELMVEDEEIFLTVSTSKKRGKVLHKPHRKKDKGKKVSKHKKLKQIKPIESPVNVPKSPAFVRWEVEDASAKVLNISEFPPLKPAERVMPNYQKLSNDLEKMYRSISAEIEELKPARLSLMDEIDDIVSFLFSDSYIQLYGSYATGLAMPWSDIDIVVVNARIYSTLDLITKLKTLGNELKRREWASSVIVLDKAAVPVVKLVAAGSFFGCIQPIEADISFEEYVTKPPSNSGMATTIVTHQILKQQPQVPFLCCFLKQLLNNNKLNTPFNGGVNSYTITLWVAAYLISTPSPESTGKLLLGFLDFFSNTFDPNTQAVSLKEGGFVPRAPTSYGVVETRDPYNLNSNTSRSAFNFEAVQALFKKARTRLTQWVSSPKKISIQSLVSSL